MWLSLAGASNRSLDDENGDNATEFVHSSSEVVAMPVSYQLTYLLIVYLLNQCNVATSLAFDEDTV